VAARMLARGEAANVTEVQKKAFPDVCAKTIGRRLKETGLVCRVRNRSLTSLRQPKRSVGSGQSSMRHGLWRTGSRSFSLMSPNTCYSSLTAANIAG
jgi:hypothetical protein